MSAKLFLPALAAAGLVSGCATYGRGYDDQYPYGYYDTAYYNQYGMYDYNNPDPRYNGYYADRYYRTDGYREYSLGANDRIYRGSDGRYYCRRGDGSTGLIVGGFAGGVLGNLIAPGGSKTIGTVLGAIGGAAVGAAVDVNVRCR